MEPQTVRDGCLGCDVVSGRLATPGGVIYEDAEWSVTHQVSPTDLAGFLILQPRRHVEHLAELSSAETAGFGRVMQAASAALMGVLQPEKVYACSFGSLVRHVHFYVLPRHSFMPADLSGPQLLNEVFSGRWRCSDAEAAEVAVRVRHEMEAMLSRG